MSFANARHAKSAVAKPSLTRTLWRNLESLPTPDQIERLITREVARAERNGLHFSLVLFRVRRGGRIGLTERRLALTLLRRIRLTDEVGWFNDEHLCALLPDTSAPGAQAFADAACDLVAKKGPRPIATVYSFPFDWIDQDDDTGGDDSTPRGGRHDSPGTGGRVSRFGDAASEDGIGFGSLSSDSIANPAPGNLPGGTLNRSGGEAVAVLERPATRQAAPTAATPTVKYEVKHLHELLVKPMPFWKRTLDVTLALFALTLLSPILIVAAIAIRLTSSGPAIFKQRRAGLGGVPFTIYKFRTMCNDAEARKKALRAVSEQDGPAFKMTRDPRITTVGHFLRKTSIDELPQLLNVLKGDMSLVGPRPLPLDEQGAAETWQQRRLDVTPGLTCIWQIKGRSQVTFAEWVRMDVTYMRRRTIFHDLAILLKTVPAVLLRRGAK